VGFTLTAVASGTATITASSYNVTSPTLSVTVAANINASAVVSGSHVETYNTVSLASTPQAAVSVTITSSNPAIATVSKSAGTVGSASITYTGVTDTSALAVFVQGQAVGSTTYTVTATGYATSTQSLTVQPAGFYLVSGSFSTTNLSSATNLQLNVAILDPATLNTTGYNVEVNPDLQPLSVSIASSNTTVGTTTAAGFTTNQYAYGSFTPSTAGTSTLSVTEPSGFTQPANYGGITATVTQAVITSSDITSGVNMESYNSFSLAQNPAGATTFTVTVANPAIAKISADDTAVGSGTITFNNVTSGGNFYYAVQGQAVGTTTVTVSGAGYSPVTNTITVDPSGVYFGAPSTTTTTFSSPTSVQYSVSILDPNSLAPIGPYAKVSPGVRPLTVAVNSSNTNVITTVNPTFNTDNYVYANITPAGTAGTATLTITQPSGFTTPSFNATLAVTVTAPGIGDASVTSSYKTEVYTSTYLGASPPSGQTVTLTVGNTAIAKIAPNSSTVGSGTMTFNNVTDTSRLYFWVQGQSVGSTTVTISSPGYATQTSTLAIEPTGFLIGTGDFTTTTLSGDSQVSVYIAALDPNTGNPGFFPTLNPDAGTVNVGVTSTNTAVGTITNPYAFTPGTTTVNGNFTPHGSGNTTLTIVPPAGFATSSYHGSVGVTVTPGTISYGGDITVGSHLQTTNYFNLNQTPPSPETVTLTIADTSVAVLSTDPTVIGSGTITYTLSDTSRPYPYIQGKAQGSTTVTISAPGYTTVTFNVSVERAGVVVGTGNTTVSAGGATYNFDVETVSLRADGYIDNYMPISPDIAPLNVSFTSSNPSAGSAATISIPVDSRFYHSNTFTSGSAGQTTITVQQPSGFATSQQEQSFTVTVQ
jgi:hypothetical protein